MRLEQDDIAPEVYETITARLLEQLRPLLNGNGKHEADDILDKKALAAFLKVSASTIDKLIVNKQIPYFKLQAGQSGGVRFSRKAIDKWIAKQTVPEINQFRGKTKCTF